MRANPATKEPEVSQSDSEDFGSVDDDSDMNLEHNSCCESGELDGCHTNKHSRSKTRENKCTTLVLQSEIDESHPGEAWLLGLMEGEYADLSIEEKLSALFALIDLLSSGYSIRLEVTYLILTTSETSTRFFQNLFVGDKVFFTSDLIAGNRVSKCDFFLASLLKAIQSMTTPTKTSYLIAECLCMCFLLRLLRDIDSMTNL